MLYDIIIHLIIKFSWFKILRNLQIYFFKWNMLWGPNSWWNWKFWRQLYRRVGFFIQLYPKNCRWKWRYITPWWVETFHKTISSYDFWSFFFLLFFPIYFSVGTIIRVGGLDTPQYKNSYLSGTDNVKSELLNECNPVPSRDIFLQNQDGDYKNLAISTARIQQHYNQDANQYYLHDVYFIEPSCRGVFIY